MANNVSAAVGQIELIDEGRRDSVGESSPETERPKGWKGWGDMIACACMLVASVGGMAYVLVCAARLPWAR